MDIPVFKNNAKIESKRLSFQDYHGQGVAKRPDVEFIFNLVSGNKDTISATRYKDFLVTFQQQTTTNTESNVTYSEFEKYFLERGNWLMHPAHDKVYQDMNLSIENYYINSSHNTYLTGNQLTGSSEVVAYSRAISSGARLVEMDVYDGRDEPIITHGGTLVSEIKFSEAVETCVNAMRDQRTSYPLILTLEMNCKNQHIMCADILSTLLPTVSMNSARNSLPLNEHKFIIRSKEINGKDKYNKIVGIKNIKYFSKSLRDIDVFHSYSLSEREADKAMEYNDFNEYTKKCLIKVYPSFNKITNNFNCYKYWNRGAQIVAMNFQYNDVYMQINRAMFADNGNCGYVLKPAFLRNGSLGGPTGITITVVCGLFYPPLAGKVRLEVEIYNASLYKDPVKRNSVEGTIVDTSGVFVTFNAQFEYELECQELAFARFLVTIDGNITMYYVIKIVNMQEGYRLVELISESLPRKNSLVVLTRRK